MPSKNAVKCLVCKTRKVPVDGACSNCGHLYRPSEFEASAEDNGGGEGEGD